MLVNVNSPHGGCHRRDHLMARVRRVSCGTRSAPCGQSAQLSASHTPTTARASNQSAIDGEPSCAAAFPEGREGTTGRLFAFIVGCFDEGVGVWRGLRREPPRRPTTDTRDCESVTAATALVHRRSTVRIVQAVGIDHGPLDEPVLEQIDRLLRAADGSDDARTRTPTARRSRADDRPARATAGGSRPSAPGTPGGPPRSRCGRHRPGPAREPRPAPAPVTAHQIAVDASGRNRDVDPGHTHLIECLLEVLSEHRLDTDLDVELVLEIVDEPACPGAVTACQHGNDVALTERDNIACRFQQTLVRSETDGAPGAGARCRCLQVLRRTLSMALHRLSSVPCAMSSIPSGGDGSELRSSASARRSRRTTCSAGNSPGSGVPSGCRSRQYCTVRFSRHPLVDLLLTLLALRRQNRG